jgi:hypothetical protein
MYSKTRSNLVSQMKMAIAQFCRRPTALSVRYNLMGTRLKYDMYGPHTLLRTARIERTWFGGNEEAFHEARDNI